jgi:LPS O-antigen subunit length determinant protein (WzzB/FepE family)
MFQSTNELVNSNEQTFSSLWNQFKKFKYLILSTTLIFFVISVVYCSIKQDVWDSRMIIQAATDDQVIDVIEINRRIKQLDPEFEMLGRQVLLNEFALFVQDQNLSGVKVRKERMLSYEIQTKADTAQEAFEKLNTLVWSLHQQFLKEYLAGVFDELNPLFEDIQQTTVERVEQIIENNKYKKF